MNYKINADPRRISGKRPNLAAENSAVDEIVTAFSSQHEPVVPLSSATTGKPSPWGKIYAILGAALLFMPFVVALVLMILNAAKAHALPALTYPILALAFRNYSFIGGLFLYLAARKANALRKTIGWLALANPLVTIPYFIMAVQYGTSREALAAAPAGVYIVNYVSLIASLLCMIALCVFAVILLVCVFRKKKQEALA